MKFFGYIFYSYLWVAFNTILFYFYRFSPKKHSTGYENIPTDRPVLFCSNHPNAFMDALLLGSAIRRRTWFLARSDVFRNKALAKFLSFIGIIPIYRLQEGTENLAKNDETFERTAKMLEQNRAIMIFSEGLCIQERRLRKLKKGTARIAFGSEERNDWKLNLTIVPVGLNYSATPWKFHRPLYISFGKPFAVNDYAGLYRADKARAMNQFTRDLEQRMKEQLVIISSPVNDKLVDQLEEMFLAKWTTAKGGDPRNPVHTHDVTKEIAGIVDALHNGDPARLETLREKTTAYFKQVEKLGIRDWLLRPETIEGLGAKDLLADFVVFFFGFPVWLFGTVTNYIPYKVPYLIAQKVVKNIEWHASVNATIATFLWQFWWLLQSLAVALIFRNWYILFAFMALVPLTGMFAQWYSVRMKKSRGKSRLIKAFRNDKELIRELAMQRAEIAGEMESLRGK